MDTEAIHNNIAEGEDAESYAEEDDAVSDEFSGTEDDSSDDDFEFKDLEKEIYGRLGGPPPELQMAMDKAMQKDHTGIKNSSSKEKKQANIGNEGSKNNRTPLQEITSKNNKKVTGNFTSEKVPENVSSSEMAVVQPNTVMKTPLMESSVMESAETKEMYNVENAKNVNKSNNTKKEESTIKEKDEMEAPKDDCGCTIM